MKDFGIFLKKSLHHNKFPRNFKVLFPLASDFVKLVGLVFSFLTKPKNSLSSHQHQSNFFVVKIHPT